VWAVTSPQLDDAGGVYLEDCAIAPVTGPDEPHGVTGYALDAERAARLWELSARRVAAPD
jgi:hypothetical protein